MTKGLDQIKRVRRYGWKIDGKTLFAEPTLEGIAVAVKNRALEQRGLQEHWEELYTEWENAPKSERLQVVQQYHTQRVAYFCMNIHNDPIQICIHDVLEDGAHRLLAARYKEMATVDCEIVECNKCLKK
jgi:hypothetical protein